MSTGLSGKKILVVDDLMLNRLLAGALLEELGASAHYACQGREALDYCKKENFDAILLDLIMPVMDGIEFLKHFRKLPGQCPVLVVTADESDELKQKALQYGAADILTKPFDPSELSAKIVLMMQL